MPLDKVPTIRDLPWICPSTIKIWLDQWPLMNLQFLMAIFRNQRPQHWMLLYLLLATTVTGTSNDDQPLWIFWLRSKFSALAPPLKVGFFVWQTVFVQLSLRKVQVTEPGREKPLGCSLV